MSLQLKLPGVLPDQWKNQAGSLIAWHTLEKISSCHHLVQETKVPLYFINSHQGDGKVFVYDPLLLNLPTW